MHARQQSQQSPYRHSLWYSGFRGHRAAGKGSKCCLYEAPLLKKTFQTLIVNKCIWKTLAMTCSRFRKWIYNVAYASIANGDCHTFMAVSWVPLHNSQVQSGRR